MSVSDGFIHVSDFNKPEHTHRGEESHVCLVVAFPAMVRPKKTPVLILILLINFLNILQGSCLFFRVFSLCERFGAAVVPHFLSELFCSLKL